MGVLEEEGQPLQHQRVGQEIRVLPQARFVQVQVPEVAALVHRFPAELGAPHADDDLLQQHGKLEALLHELLLLPGEALVSGPERFHPVERFLVGLLPSPSAVHGVVETNLKECRDGVNHVRGRDAGVPVLLVKAAELEVHQAKLRGTLLELGRELLLQLRAHVRPVLLAFHEGESHLGQHQLDLFLAALLPSPQPRGDVGRVEEGVCEGPVLEHHEVTVLLVMDPLRSQVHRP
mmetsp:Transcript_530/g.1507  ORF Transcript_530/g.1507 Transcript_530/m.1507 type:complete len:234 (+) Transcript_530:469-1170(+)